MDKFLMLVRKLIRAALVVAARQGWDDDFSEALSSFLGQELVVMREEWMAPSLTFHVCDVFVDELLSACTGNLGKGRGRARIDVQSSQQLA